MVDELDLVPEEFREEILTTGPRDGGNVSVKSSVTIETLTSWVERGRRVFVSFYTDRERTSAEMYIKENRALQQITEKAHQMYPSYKWKVMSGDSLRSKFEFTSDRQVWNAIEQGPTYIFDYLTVRLEPVGNGHGANCDSCYREIVGHRFKCTECANFDICSSCEKGSIHGEHAMLRIVGKGRTHIPYWIKERISI